MTWPIGKVRFDSSLDVKILRNLERRERPGRLVDRDTFPRALEVGFEARSRRRVRKERVTSFVRSTQRS